MPKKEPEAVPKGRPGTPATNMRLEPWVLDALERIARREGLTYAGSPSRAKAVRWLVEEDRRRNPEPEGGA